VRTLPAGGMPATDGAPRVTFAAVGFGAMAFCP
jgi:hypothetical protein